METDSQRKYVALMKKVKYRANAIELFGNIPSHGMYRQIRFEFICLQLRFIIESLAMACLVANGDDMEEVTKKLTKEYRPEAILRSLEAINPHCYPQPVTLIEDAATQQSLPVGLAGDLYKGEIKERTGNDWLTREEIRRVYGRLGQALHATNPMRQDFDLDCYERDSIKWYHKVVNLVTHHKVTVLDDQKMYIVVVRHADNGTPINPGAKVQVAEFHRTDD